MHLKGVDMANGSDTLGCAMALLAAFKADPAVTTIPLGRLRQSAMTKGCEGKGFTEGLRYAAQHGWLDTTDPRIVAITDLGRASW